MDLQIVGYMLITLGIFVGMTVGWSWFSLWKLENPALYFGGWVAFLLVSGSLLIFIN